ncbi:MULTISPECIES: acyltransferase [Bacillus cereus group]|uniref:acyltransferase n=1 Tax=Bacillus cereus group TaxID=86661 RepID=UPI0001A09B8F|nr:MULTISPECIES: DapH/DapD/GlmU-related protein [Bacillus cereus group]EEL48454.1 hypothetical protein bcere0022_43170 [Bacillus cereus Rock3-44]PFO80438.1 acetyltransferase [Bacillus cereus]
MYSYLVRLLKAKIRGEYSIETLKDMGLVVGRNFNKQDGCIIDPSHCWHICIGDDVTLAPRVHILAHDASTKIHLGYTKIGNVIIGSRVFVGASTIILPNVKIGDDVVIGAGSVVAKDIPSNSVAVGNPARVVCSLQDYIEKNRDLMKIRPVYDEKWTLRQDMTKGQKAKMVKNLEDGIGYVE